jgi:Gpi18-like mannosyltransferase
MRHILQPRYLNILVPLCCFVGIVFTIPYLPEGHQYDRQCWFNWSLYMFHQGLSNVYDTDTNYLPLYQYAMYLYAKICGGAEAIFANLSYMRLFTLAFDWLGFWYVYLWTEKKIPYYVLILIGTINLGHSYNTLLWGQVDGISSTLVFISIYYGHFRKSVLSTLFFVLAVNMKLQSAIFLPLWGYFYLSRLLETKRINYLVFPLLAAAGLQLIILLPFINKLPRIWHVVVESFGKFPVVSMGAFNFWHLTLGDKVWTLPDGNSFLLNLTYKQTGLILFFLVCATAMIPLLMDLYKKLRQQRSEGIDRVQTWCVAGITALAFFYFPTEMHERYSHPAFLFIMAYSVYQKDYFPYLLFSLAYFVNLECIIHAFWLSNDGFLFDTATVGGEYAIILAYLFFRHWKASANKPSLNMKEVFDGTS